MKTVKCVVCGVEFEQNQGRGRPRTKCPACAPSQKKVTEIAVSQDVPTGFVVGYVGTEPVIVEANPSSDLEG